jgi:hypothetical protein
MVPAAGREIGFLASAGWLCRHGKTGAFASMLFAEFDQTIAIEFLEMQMARSLLKKSKTCAIRLAFRAAPALFWCR